jgi:hypothetical protein
MALFAFLSLLYTLKPPLSIAVLAGRPFSRRKNPSALPPIVHDKSLDFCGGYDTMGKLPPFPPPPRREEAFFSGAKFPFARRNDGFS